MSNVVSHARLQFRFSWNLVICCYLVDTGNAQMFQPYLYRLADRKCAPVLLSVHSFGPMRLEHCKARSAEIGCVSFESFFVSTRRIKEIMPSKECINLGSMKVFSSSLKKKLRDSSGVRTKHILLCYVC